MVERKDDASVDISRDEEHLTAIITEALYDSSQKLQRIPSKERREVLSRSLPVVEGILR